MTGQDISFSHLLARFKKNIYQSRKGEVRMALVLRALAPYLSVRPALTVLDAAGGLGQMTHAFAHAGHAVTYNDLSAEMLTEAQHLLASSAPKEGRVSAWVQGPLQTLTGEFDLVLGHAVLEWMVDPEEGIRALCDRVKPGGHLSVLFYNAESIRFKNLIKGNLYKVARGTLAGDGKGLTPISPLDAATIESALSRAGMQVDERYGVRCFTDFMWPMFKDNPKLEDQIEWEWVLGLRDDYRAFARYQHFIAHKPH
ncbi:methyltransferase [Salinispirillum marinum]|uniref:Methyltransferase n=2 Tax=Saccharospirillaceae TaxID=255527 RepID=A0ABV8BH80_9GAMM